MKDLLYTIGHILFWIIFKVFFFLQCKGLENIPKKGSCLLASNHVSFFDPPAIGTVIVKRKIYFIARASLFKFPIVGLILKLVHSIPIELKGNWEETLKIALKFLKDDKAILVFPEGTRSPDGKLKRGKSGIGFLAYNSRVPVIPVYIKGSFNAFPKGAKIIKPFKKILIRFGEQINLDEFFKLPAKNSTYKKITETIMNAISKLN